jgi:hypothetical protein
MGDDKMVDEFNGGQRAAPVIGMHHQPQTQFNTFL